MREILCGRRAALVLLAVGFLAIGRVGFGVYQEGRSLIRSGWGSVVADALQVLPTGENARRAAWARWRIDNGLKPELMRRARAMAPAFALGLAALLVGTAAWRRRPPYCVLWGRNPYRRRPGFVIARSRSGLVRLPPQRHALIFAPSGTGKSVTLAHGLLEWPGSAVVVDPKGELARLTSAYRSRVLGQDVAIWDILRPTYPIPIDQLYGGRVRALERLAALYKRSQARGDSAFIAPWETVLRALILDAEHRGERAVWQAALAVSPMAWRDAMFEIAQEPDNPGSIPARDALLVIEQGERYFASIVGSTMEVSELLRRIAPALDAPAPPPRFDASTIYITLHDNAPEQALLANWLLGGLYEALKGAHVGAYGLMWVLDEVGVLRPPLLPDMVRIGRGRGQGVIAVSQSLADLYAAYGPDEARALLSNLNGPVSILGIHQADEATSDYVAGRLESYIVITPQPRDPREARDFPSRAEAAAEVAARLRHGVMLLRKSGGPVPIRPAPYYRRREAKAVVGSVGPRLLDAPSVNEARPLGRGGKVGGVPIEEL